MWGLSSDFGQGVHGAAGSAGAGVEGLKWRARGVRGEGGFGVRVVVCCLKIDQEHIQNMPNINFNILCVCPIMFC